MPGAIERDVAVLDGGFDGLAAIGLPDDSYVWHKINGTQNSVGGSGVRMPKNSPPLNAQQKDLIEQWILDGALP